jgi:hypothetical protein
VLAALTLLGAASPASAQTLTWSLVPSPSPGAQNILYAVSCASATVCTAVGDSRSTAHVNSTLIESWDGTSWSVVPSPSPSSIGGYLFGVSCVSAVACTAVGGSAIESWDGTSWSLVPNPSPAGDLKSVSCFSATACTAAGYAFDPSNDHYKTFIESWNGASWSMVPSPNSSSNNFFNGVSCVSATACTAAGYSYKTSSAHSKTLIESWNGTRWSVVSTPNPRSSNYLYGVSCVSATTCTAVGDSLASAGDKTLIESWDGTSWSVVPSPTPRINSNLYGVSCASAAVCTAAGSDRGKTLIESWDGTSWSVVPSPTPRINSNLYGVSCASAAVCTAAGYSQALTRHAHSKTLIESGTASGASS